MSLCKGVSVSVCLCLKGSHVKACACVLNQLCVEESPVEATPYKCLCV